MLKNLNWWKAAGLRAVRTFAQDALSLIPVAASVAEVDFAKLFGTAALAAVLSMFTSLAGLPELDDGTPRKWIKAVGVRMLKTAAQTAVAMIPLAISITEVDWLSVASCCAMAALVSLLMSLKGLPEVDEPC